MAMRIGNRNMGRGKGHLLVALALLLLWMVVPASPVAAVDPPVAAGQLVRVGVGRALDTAEVIGENGLAVLGPDGKVLMQWPPNQALVFSLSPLPAGGASLFRQIQAAIPGGPPMLVHPGPLTLKPVPGADKYLKFRNRRYQGDLEVRAVAGDKLGVINSVPTEEYLRGVVPLELGPANPPEALKAQAVAARTYALYQRGRNKAWLAEGFDLTDDTSSQVYRGVEAHAPQTDAAIAVTRGMVVTYGGKLIEAFFFSSAGGHTEDNEAVFASGSPIPYLRGVPDFDNGNQWYRWEVQKTAAELATELRALDGFKDVGDLVAVEPAGKQGSGGRWSHWRIRGDQAEQTITGSQLRFRLGLRSNPREVAAVVPPTSPIQQITSAGNVVVLGAAGAKSQVMVGTAMAVVGGRSPAPAALPGAGIWVETALPDVANGPVAAFIFRGGGNGHGVGMSQTGAAALARQGKSFVEILTHYYTGTVVLPYTGS